MDWEYYRDAFFDTCSWRDIYVLGSNIEDWQRLLDFLYDAPYKIVDCEDSPLPKEVQQISEMQKTTFVGMSIDLGGILVNSCFFLDSEIEFDIDPRNITDEKKLAKLFDFMRAIGNLMNKEVILTEEGHPDLVWFRFVPGSESVQFTPHSSH